MVKHFLIAEDDEDDIELFKEAIIDSGLPIKVTAVVYCGGIFDSVDLNTPPYLIIIDGNLPGKSLIQCITEVRSHESLAKIPLVVLTSALNTIGYDDIYRAGSNLYLEKPDSFNKLVLLFKRLYQVDWRLHPVLRAEEFFELPLVDDAV